MILTKQPYLLVSKVVHKGAGTFECPKMTKFVEEVGGACPKLEIFGT